MSEKVECAAATVADHMDQILKVFKPGSKITVIVRQPDDPEGLMDFCLSNDSLDEAIALLQRRKGGAA